MTSFLQTLHDNLEIAYTNNQYVSFSNLKQKNKILMSEVFKEAQQQINEGLTHQAKYQDKNSDYTYLKKLKKDGNHFYSRYLTRTNRFSRRLLKFIATHLPAFIGRSFPPYQLNQITTQKNYNSYKTFISTKKAELKKEMESIVEKDGKTIDQAVTKLKQGLEHLNSMPTRPLTEGALKKLLNEQFLTAFQLIDTIQIDQDIRQPLESKFENLADFNTIQTFYESREKLRQSLEQDDHNTLLQLFADTPWSVGIQEAFNSKNSETITFGMGRIGNNNILNVFDHQNKRINENKLNDYRGIVSVSLSNDSSIDLLKELEKLIQDDKRHFHPCCLMIHFKTKTQLKPEMLQQMSQLKASISEIQIINLDALDLTSLDDQFMDQIKSLEFKNLNHLSLKWTSEDTVKVESIVTSIHVDFPALQSLSLEAGDITDAWIQDCIQQPFVKHLKTLDLTHCSKLTTDCLIDVIALKQLEVKLPKLDKGQQLLDQLPTFEDPTQIARFYLSSRYTRRIANQRYTGPFTKASVFQIPLNLKRKTVMTQPILDPYTVSRWLDPALFKSLEPQNSVTTVFADGQTNTVLTDDQLIAFMSKFPNTTFLSLCDSPGVTCIGLSTLLEKKTCPKLKRLDLTGWSANDRKIIQKYFANIVVVADNQSIHHDSSPYQKNLNPFDAQVSDFTISFKKDNDSQPENLILPRSVLYSLSSYFRSRFRLGGKLENVNQAVIINEHLTSEGVQAFQSFVKIGEFNPKMRWQTAAALVAIVDSCLGFDDLKIKQTCLDFMHSQFEMTQAEELIKIACQLNDEVGLKQYEELLVQYLESNPTSWPKMMVFANSFPFDQLRTKAKEWESLSVLTND